MLPRVSERPICGREGGQQGARSRTSNLNRPRLWEVGTTPADMAGADVVTLELKPCQSSIGLQGLGDHDRALVADLVVPQVKFGQRGQDLDRGSQGLAMFDTKS